MSTAATEAHSELRNSQLSDLKPAVANHSDSPSQPAHDEQQQQQQQHFASPPPLLPPLLEAAPPSLPSSPTSPPPAVVQHLLSADAICFDVDSTVITEEGIDVLAAHLGLGAQVCTITSAAMNGGLPFHEALALRLSLLRPSRSDIASCLASHPLSLTPHLLSLLSLLRSAPHCKPVFLVTGGFYQMLAPVMAALCLRRSQVFANDLLFDADGGYLSYDSTQPTSMSGGKARAIARIMSGAWDRDGDAEDEDGDWDEREEDSPRLDRVVMIGDGATDLEARPPACCFIGYGGVVQRQKVKEGADWFITDWRQLMAVFQQEGGESGKAARAVDGAEGRKQRKVRCDKGVKRGERKRKQPLPAEPPHPPARLTAEERKVQAEAAVAAIDQVLAELSSNALGGGSGSKETPTEAATPSSSASSTTTSSPSPSSVASDGSDNVSMSSAAD